MLGPGRLLWEVEGATAPGGLAAIPAKPAPILLAAIQVSDNMTVPKQRGL